MENDKVYIEAKVKVGEEEVYGCDHFDTLDYLMRKLIEESNIDTTYYHVKLRKVTSSLDNYNKGYIFDIEYYLVRRPEWKDLEECDERLKGGL